MSGYVIDEKGKWKVQRNCKILIEPSKEYIAEKETIRLEEEKLNNLKPSQEEVEKADRQVNLINDLTELGVI